jgi:hypothetical protein
MNITENRRYYYSDRKKDMKKSCRLNNSNNYLKEGCDPDSFSAVRANVDRFS